MRFESPAALETLNRLYAQLRLLVNFVYPCAKLVSKTRSGSHVARIFDRPATPYARALAHPELSDKAKHELSAMRSRLDPVALAREVRALQDSLPSFAAPLTNPRLPYKVFHRSEPSAPPSS